MPYAWVIVGACAVMMALAFGAVSNVAVFLTPLAADFGWPRAGVSLAYSVATIASGLGGIAMGYFADRLPVRRVLLCGALAPAIALVLLSRMTSTFELYAYHALMGAVGLGAVMAPANNLAAQWLARRPGLAIGVVAIGAASGQGLLPYFARYLIVTEGWRQAYLTLGVAYGLIMMPLTLLVRDAPRAPAASFAVAAQGNPYTLSRPQLLALLSLAAALCCVCMSTPMMHVVALGSDYGLSERDAAGLLAVMAIAGMAGRIAFGRFSDRAGSLRAYMAASLGQTVLAVLFPYATTRAELYLLSSVFGFIFSGAMVSFIVCAREYAPSGKTGLSIGIVMFFAWLGMALGAWQGGLFYDLCGDYFRSFFNASLAGVANLLILAILFLHTFQPGIAGRFRLYTK